MLQILVISESLGADGQLSRTLKLEDKDKEQKRETNGSKDKERYREKYWGKSIQELDLSNCQLCTPSYRHLPEDVCNFYFISFLLVLINIFSVV